MTDLPKAVEEFWKAHYYEICYGDKIAYDNNVQTAIAYTEDILNNPDSPVRIALEAAGNVYHGAPLKDFEMLKQALAVLEIKK